MSDSDNRHYKAIKSYVVRAGRLTTGQAKAIELLGDKYIIDYDNNALSNIEKAGNYNRNIMEIGFGMGQATAHIAGLMPEDFFLCCEVHQPGVGSLLKLMGENNIDNIRIMQHDAKEVLENTLPDAWLDGVHIFFPDPWHKKRHNKRRLIQNDFVNLLCKKIKSGGYIHLATDWQEYAEQMLEVLSDNILLKNTAFNNGYADKPEYRPLTKFENRGIKLGHGVWDLVFNRV